MAREARGLSIDRRAGPLSLKKIITTRSLTSKSWTQIIALTAHFKKSPCSAFIIQIICLVARGTFFAFKDGASFCYCAYVLRILEYSGFLRNLPLIQQYFCAVYYYVEKADLSKGYQNPKRKLGVTTHFSEVIEL